MALYFTEINSTYFNYMKLFADDSPLFARVTNVTDTHEKLKEGIQATTDWAYQREMFFNADISNQAVEVIFSVTTNKPVYPPRTSF